MHNFSRLLNDKDLVEHFLVNVLAFSHPQINKIIDAVVDGELGVVSSKPEHQTLTSSRFRERNYKSEDRRWELRQKIIDELLSLPRLDEDEKIKMGKGGALPKIQLRSERKAFIVIGLPASGKSTIASTIADDYGAVILDSDFAKRKLPEFKRHLYGASIVHEESHQITFKFSINNPGKMLSVFESCLAHGHNLVIPKIGQSPEGVLKLASTLKEKNGYEIHLILVHLMKKTATVRALCRFHQTKRYVPLGMIFDGYGNDPCMCYFYLRGMYSDFFATFGMVSTDEFPTTYCDAIGESPVLRYPFKKNCFMKKSGGPKNAKTPEKVMAKPKAPTSRRALKTYIAERTAALAYLMELEERSLYLMIEAAENMATNTRK